MSYIRKRLWRQRWARFGPHPGEDGPVARALLAYREVCGLVFGAWGEASAEVHQLLSLCARTGARAWWRTMGCPDEASAIGCMAWLLRRRWAMTALRENARLKLDRLEFVGRGAVAAAHRRTAAAELQASRLRAAAGHLLSGPRARFPRSR